MTASAQPSGGLLGAALARVVRGYQLAVSPVMAPHCRYWPSCSEYAIEALRSHGALRGGWLATRRLCRCHPWSAGGVDLVPAPLDREPPGTPSASVAPLSSLTDSSRSPDVIGAAGSRSSYARRAAPSARTPIPD